MNKIISFFKDSVNILIVLAIISITIALFTLSKNITDTAVNDANSLQNNLVLGRYSDYDGTEVTGSEVTSAIKLKADENFTIKVTTKAATTSSEYNSANGYTISDPTNSKYIEPTGKFSSTLIHDGSSSKSNGSIVGIEFVQK